ncbi:hypothetical protein Poly59_36190 [Rubripirellula reticaptiva]|uniref:Uncharacterized protein n=1 Tax=Rubripirellula reticaptiva TaxID=2528013 RepID=A0A5C6ESM4_9BACT|nr:hypothetical protein Poly59_36190 [Rubripirellula reticaptiva]
MKRMRRRVVCFLVCLEVVRPSPVISTIRRIKVLSRFVAPLRITSYNLPIRFISVTSGRRNAFGVARFSTTFFGDTSYAFRTWRY